MPNWEIYAEADRRGILPTDKKELFEEARRRGLVPKQYMPVTQSDTETMANIAPLTPAQEFAVPDVESPEFKKMSSLTPEEEKTASAGRRTVFPGAVGMAGAFVGGIPGAGGGYALGKQLANAVDISKGNLENVPKTPLEVGKEFATDVGIGAGLEFVGGKAVPWAISKMYRWGEPYINRVIDWGIEKGLRPSVVGKQTAGQLKQYMGRAREAVKTIIANKENLELTDEAGDIVKGELPKNLKQFSEAIGQLKKKIFAQYDAMAGKAGASIELKPIADELEKAANNTVLNDLSPEIAKYARTRAQALAKRGTYTAQEAQDAIAHLNDSLEAFYKNPSYETASVASIDKMIVNHLRKDLDSAIEGAVGPGYQELKNTYGALSSIEKDVTHRAIVDARKNVKGLIDFSDIFSGGQVVEGILSLNPVKVGKGIAQKGLSMAYRHANSPNRIVDELFNKVDKALTGGKALETAPLKYLSLGEGVTEQGAKAAGRLGAVGSFQSIRSHLSE